MTWRRLGIALAILALCGLAVLVSRPPPKLWAMLPGVWECEARSPAEYLELLDEEFYGESDYYRAARTPAHMLVTFPVRDDLMEGNHFQMCQCTDVLWVHRYHNHVEAYGLHTGELLYAQSLTDFSAYCGGRSSVLRYSRPPAAEDCTCAAFTPSIDDLTDLVWLAAANDLTALLPRILEIDGAEEIDAEEAQRLVWR